MMCDTNMSFGKRLIPGINLLAIDLATNKIFDTLFCKKISPQKNE